MELTTTLLRDALEEGLPTAPHDSDLTSRIGKRTASGVDHGIESALGDRFVRDATFLMDWLEPSFEAWSVVALKPAADQSVENTLKQARDFLCFWDDMRGYAVVNGGTTLVTWQPGDQVAGVLLCGRRQGEDGNEELRSQVAVSARRADREWRDWRFKSNFRIWSDIRLWQKVRELHTINLVYATGQMMAAQGAPASAVQAMEKQLLMEKGSTALEAWTRLRNSVNIRTTDGKLRKQFADLSLPLTAEKLSVFTKALGLTEKQRAHIHRSWQDQYRDDGPPPRFTSDHFPCAVIMEETADGFDALQGNFHQEINHCDIEEMSAMMLVRQLSGKLSSEDDKGSSSHDQMLKGLEGELSRSVTRVEQIDASVWQKAKALVEELGEEGDDSA